MYRLINAVTSDGNNRLSSIDDRSRVNEDESIPKRKPRRVRSLIKSSIEDMLDETHGKVSNTRRNSAASTTTVKRSFPFGQCRVCMDKATGAHYGVPTCEGCKGFFKRSILRKEKYRCYFGDRCIINADNRNRCKSCRFHKCLKEGMSVEGVRMGRIPKLVKEKALAEYHLSSSSTENDEFNSPLPSPTCSQSMHSSNIPSNDFEFQLIDEPSFLDQIDSTLFDPSSEKFPPSINENDDDDDDDDDDDEEESFSSIPPEKKIDEFSQNTLPRIRELVKKIPSTMVEVQLTDDEAGFLRYLRWKMIDTCRQCNAHVRQIIEGMNTMIHLRIRDFPGDCASLQDVLSGLTDAIPIHVKNLITFAREAPAIRELNSNDFHRIMNNRLFDYWLIKHAPLIRNEESYIMLPNGLQYTRRWMVKILGEEMVDAMFDFAKRFNAVNFTVEEQALILPVVICFHDVALIDQETVRNIRNCFLYILYTQMLSTRSLSDAKIVYRSLLQIFASLPFLNELQEKRIAPLIPENMGSE